MAHEKPPAWTPSSGQIGQVPLALSQDVDASGVHPASGQDVRTLAAAIVRANQPVINRFVAMQRQHIEIGAKDVHRAVLPLQSMAAYYSHTQGLERMHYHITPEAEAPPLPPLAPLPEIPVPEIPVPEIPVPKIPVPEIPVPEVPVLEEPPEKPEPPIPLVRVTVVHHDKPQHLIIGFRLDSVVTNGPNSLEYTIRTLLTESPNTVPPEAGGLRDSPSVSVAITLHVDRAVQDGKDIGQPVITCSPTSVGGGGTWLGGPQITFDESTAPPLMVDDKPVSGFYAVKSIPFKVEGVPLYGPVVSVFGRVPGSFDPDTGMIDWIVFNTFYYLVQSDGISPVTVELSPGTITWKPTFIDTNNNAWQAVGANATSVYYIPATGSDEVIIESVMLTRSGVLESPQILSGFGSSSIIGTE